MVVCFSNILTWQNGKLATIFWSIRCFQIFYWCKFGTLWEGGGNSSHMSFCLKETGAKTFLCQMSSDFKSIWKEISHLRMADGRGCCIKQRRKSWGSRRDSSMQCYGNSKRENSQTWKARKFFVFYSWSLIPSILPQQQRWCLIAEELPPEGVCGFNESSWIDY